MTDILVVEELRETRRRLAEQCGGDAQRYAAMLQELSRTLPGGLRESADPTGSSPQVLVEPDYFLSEV